MVGGIKGGESWRLMSNAAGPLENHRGKGYDFEMGIKEPAFGEGESTEVSVFFSCNACNFEVDYELCRWNLANPLQVSFLNVSATYYNL